MKHSSHKGSFPGRILVSDDDVDTLELISCLLSQTGSDIEEAEDGSSTLESVETAAQSGEPFDVILLDMKLPDMCGAEVAKRLRDSGCDALILGLSANNFDKALEQAALESGCDAFWHKLRKVNNIVEELEKAYADRKSSLDNHVIQLSPLPVIPDVLMEKPELVNHAIKFLDKLPEQTRELYTAIDTEDYRSLLEKTLELSSAGLLGYGIFADLIEKVQNYAKASDAHSLLRVKQQLQNTTADMLAGKAVLLERYQ